MNPALLAVNLLPKQPEAWQPMSQRLAGEPIEEPIEDFPDYLCTALVSWAATHVKEPLAKKVMLRLRQDQDQNLNWAGTLCARLKNPWVDHALDILDALVFFGRLPLGKALDELDEILTDGGSVWRTDVTEGCLERRVGAATKQLVQTAKASGTAAGK
jgi:hypothetical protein